MKSKIEAAKIAVRSGIPLVIASGKKKNVLAKILAARTKARCLSRSPTSCRAASAGLRFSIIPKARCSWTTARSWRCAKRQEPAAAGRGALRGRFAPATWCGSAIWTGRNSRAASRGSIPPPSARANCPRRNWCIAMIW
jgi:hypothetical protein